MATYKIVKNSGKTKASLKRVIDYVGNEKNSKGDEKVFKTTGINISDEWENAYKDMLMSKEIHNQNEGRQYRHHIQSFKPGEVSPELAHKIGVEFAKKNFKDFDVFVSTHIDKEHIHNHFIINSVCNKTGLKLEEVSKFKFEDLNKKLESHQLFLGNLRNENDNICEKYNLSSLRNNENIKSVNIYNSKEYYIYKKAINNEKESYKLDLSYSIKEISEKSENKKEFIAKMKKEKNIIVIWGKNKKNITFKFNDPDKKNIRLSNLEKTYKDSFFTKESLEKKFNENAKNNKIKVKKENIYTFIQEKNKNNKDIEKYRNYIMDSYKLALNKLSKNEYFKIDTEIKQLKYNFSNEKIEKEKEQILLNIREKEKELQKIEKDIFSEFGSEKVVETKNEVIKFYEEKIKKTVEKNIDLYDNISEFKQKTIENVRNENMDSQKKTFLLKNEIKKFKAIQEKYKKIDIQFLALNNVTKGAAKRLTKEFYLLEREKEKLNSNSGIIEKVKNALLIKDIEQKQIKLQKNFSNLKEEFRQPVTDEISRIIKLINENQELLNERIEINKGIIEVIKSERERFVSLKNNELKNSGGGIIIKNNEEKGQIKGKSYNFDEELGEKKKKKGMGI